MHEVVDEEARRPAVPGGKQLPVGRGVGEGDFLRAQVAAVHEGAPGRKERAVSPRCSLI